MGRADGKSRHSSSEHSSGRDCAVCGPFSINLPQRSLHLLEKFDSHWVMRKLWFCKSRGGGEEGVIEIWWTS